MKVDFHFHLEEGPYSTNWLQRTAKALSTMHSGKDGKLQAATNSLTWITEVNALLNERVNQGGFHEDWLALYFQQGKKQGIEQFGIVDHLYRFTEFRAYYERHMVLDETPMGKMQRYWLERTQVGSIETYIAAIRKAQAAGYPVALGVEADYFPGGEAELGELLSRYELDYVIGSVHFIEGWGFDNPELQDLFQEKDLPALYRQGFDYVKAAAASGLFDIIAHLDNLKVFNYRPDEQILLPMYDDVAKALKQADVATEVNTGLAYRYPVKEMCPSPAFVNSLFKHGVPITLSSDAHFPDDLGTFLDEAKEMLEQAGYKEIVYFKQRKRIHVSL